MSAETTVVSDRQKRWLYGCSAVYLAALGISIFYEFYYAALLPLVLGVIWLALYRLDILLIVIAACVPVSINLEDLGIGGVGMYLPTEPLLFGILLLAILKLLSASHIDRRIFKHPVSLLLYLYIVWMLLTAISSALPLVSVKFILAKLWFIVPYYFLGVHVFMDERKSRWFKMAYLFPLFGVILYTVTRHASYGFDKESSHWVMEPLFKDHTSYGAVLAMFFPVLAGMLLQKKTGPALRMLLSLGMVILVTGIIFSYTRAAWLSIFGAAAVLVLLVLRIPLRSALLGLALTAGLVYAGWEDIQVALQRNKQESSDRLDEHISSVSNVSSDASNLERLNRWNCAWEMFKERPVFGWGPGTYQFVYAPFQRSGDRTIISTNVGDGGNAHSEYLGPLSEQGFPGMLIMVALVFMVSSLGFRLYFQITNAQERILITSVYLGLMTYFIHGTLNNYLDTDKASVPFWAFIAMMVAADLKLQQTKAMEAREQQPE
jgi:O-antigen ligase